ncbi:UPF0236 family protein, partial [bacterium]|nr:UPF0236 family protein [bacterium]
MLTLIDTVSDTVRQSMTTFVENRLRCKANELVSEVSVQLLDSLFHAGREGLKAFLEGCEPDRSSIERDGQVYRLKDRASRKFLTLFGELEVERRYFYNDRQGRGITPLDEAWQMQGRYATPEVVERILWTSSPLTPSESAEAFSRLTAFKPSVACIQDIISRDGGALTIMLGNEIGTRAGEKSRRIEVPEQTEVFVASLDGANVLMRGTRRNKGEHENEAEAREAEPAETETGQGYRNAMVGSFSSYARVEKVVDMETGLEGLGAHRLGSQYCARMPEAGAVQFKKEFEAMLEEADGRLRSREKAGLEEVTRILLLDGARPLWNYVENNPLFEGYRLLLDFYHASEHLSELADALFGKDSGAGREWYENWRFKLKYEEGAVTGILRSASRHREKQRPGRKREKAVRKQETFFRRNRKRMNYQEH